MLTAIGKGEGTGRPLLLIGLSAKNMEELLKGHPIPLKVEKLLPGMNFDLCIMGGANEAAMEELLTQHGLVEKGQARQGDGHAQHYKGGPLEG
jgi:hypothetical protein